MSLFHDLKNIFLTISNIGYNPIQSEPNPEKTEPNRNPFNKRKKPNGAYEHNTENPKIQINRTESDGGPERPGLVKTFM